MASKPSGSVKDIIDLAYKLRTVEDCEEPFQTMQQLLEPWREPSNPSTLQPAALEILNDSHLMVVVILKHWDKVLKMLLSFNVDIQDSVMSLAVHTAKQRRDFTPLRALFESVWDINRPLNSHCPPAISLVLQHPDFVDACLALGADPDSKAESGHTTMQRAVGYAPFAMIKLLVDRGAVVAGKNLLPHAALAYIDTPGGPEILDRLEVSKYLIERGALLDACYIDTYKGNTSGDYLYYGRMTALHFAIIGGKRDLIELLLDSGADAGIGAQSAWKTDWEVISSVALAQKCGFEDIASMLREREMSRTDIGKEVVYDG